jgi:hypothetical protein
MSFSFFSILLSGSLLFVRLEHLNFVEPSSISWIALFHDQDDGSECASVALILDDFVNYLGQIVTYEFLSGFCKILLY